MNAKLCHQMICSVEHKSFFNFHFLLFASEVSTKYEIKLKLKKKNWKSPFSKFKLQFKNFLTRYENTVNLFELVVLYISGWMTKGKKRQLTIIAPIVILIGAVVQLWDRQKNKIKIYGELLRREKN